LDILLTTPSYPPINSGLGNAVQQQAALLVSNGFSVVVATAGKERGQRKDGKSGALIEEFDVQGADCWLNQIRGDVSGYERFLLESNFDIVLMNAWQTWSTDLCLKNLERVRGRKYLYSHCLSTNIFFLHQPFRSSVRYLLWRPYWWRLPKRMKQLDGLLFLAANGCDSRFDDLILAKKLGIPFHIVPNALSSDAMVAIEQPVAERESRQQLIAIGAYEWQKGHDFVLNAYALSKAKNIIPLKLFGQRYTTFTEKLDRQANDLGISSGYILFYEGISGAALLEECRRSIMLLSGSHTECQPLVLLDSMTMGTPFVARSTGCTPYLSGGVGVKTVLEAAQTIDRLLLNNCEWDRLSKAGKNEISEKNNPTRVGKELISALVEMKLPTFDGHLN
jgi:1,2-diacylglycerol 3-alpha-glucosyltransferase